MSLCRGIKLLVYFKKYNNLELPTEGFSSMILDFKRLDDAMQPKFRPIQPKGKFSLVDRLNLGPHILQVT